MPGRRSDPPWSVPCASQTSPVASDTAPPPVEPPQVSDVFHGLRVRPNTSLNVVPPAPNSGVFDFAMTMPPLRSIRSTTGWDRAGTWSRKIGEPYVVRTPATSVRSLIATGSPAEPAGLVCCFAILAVHQPLRMFACAIDAECRQRVDRGLDFGDARRGGVDQVERRYLALAQPGYGFGRGQADEFLDHVAFPDQASVIDLRVEPSRRGAVLAIGGFWRADGRSARHCEPGPRDMAE